MTVSGSEPTPLDGLQPEQFEGCDVGPPEFLVQAQRSSRP
jgi:hypothetical protein